MNRRAFTRLTLATAVLPALPRAARAVEEWDGIVDLARGQEVWWHAWGGDPKINDFIAWVGGLAAERFGITLTQVKIASTADSVAAVLAERDAGKTTGGAVDLIWINGENFAAMKREGLLYGPFAERLPNWRLVDVAGKPAVVTDFTLPTEGYESPWAMAQLVFEYDSARLPEPPRSIAALQDWILANPGRFTFPKPPDYLGVTFLKQVLYATLPDPAILQSPVDPATFAATIQPLRDFLASVEPALWREGRAYPDNESALGQLLADGEIDIAFAFNPGRASAEIAAGTLPDSIRTFTLQGGTIGNASFLAIPFNSSAKEAAQVIANLLLSPEVQARAQDAATLGFQTVLNLKALRPEDRARFDALSLGPATLPPDQLGPALLEPHASWATALAEDWTTRSGTGD
ncbi:ABC transporter substrate-binding protein [Rhodobacter sp. Har01]|uniref:ABC transporter substrate-binding protein n=1 Tax=Rhodobacter sp. Har01 TaxID=2883999 RepID=UPI001D08E503|nr:ABC transporter substrate-binding protein [Rhodobacter sp. Har01]MCB6177512.1 ABC transporter substrate-binding protein [Rhodobacter sp. Har01]